MPEAFLSTNPQRAPVELCDAVKVRESICKVAIERPDEFGQVRARVLDLHTEVHAHMLPTNAFRRKDKSKGHDLSRDRPSSLPELVDEPFGQSAAFR